VPKTKNSTYKVASLFSGCGGMDLGVSGGFSFLGKEYERLNTEVVFAADFDPKIGNIYNSNFPVKCKIEDVRKIKSGDIPKHEILTGGFPCQSFSVVAQNPKRLGYKDARGKLFFEICRILKERKPKIFVAENVKGILSANGGTAFPLIIKEFEKVGYHVKFQVLNAAEFGIPQKRQRVFIVGFKDENTYKKFKFPEPLLKTGHTPLSRVLIQSKDVEEKYYFSDRAVAGMRKTKHALTMNKGRAQKLSEPCNTVSAHLAKVSLNSTDPVLRFGSRYRMFTPREVARIQSFPDSFVLSGTRAVNYKALGNAVPPVLMWHVTRQILSAIEN